MEKSVRPFIDKRIGFYPIHVNANLLSSERAISLYRFIKTIFPQIGQAVSASAFSDLTKGIKHWSSSITETERKELAKSLKGVSISINISIEEEGKGEIISIPFYIKTDHIIEDLIRAKPSITKLDTEAKELKEVLLPIIKSAIKQRIKDLVEGFLTLEVLRPEVRVEIKQLIEDGLITKEGKMAKGVDLDHLLCDEYSAVFKKVDMQELVKCGLIKVDYGDRPGPAKKRDKT